MEEEIAASFMTDGNLARDLRGPSQGPVGRASAPEEQNGGSRTSQPAPRTAHGGGSPLRPSNRPAEPQRQAAPEPRRAEPGSGGWVSDLLRRASREEDDEPMHPAVPAPAEQPQQSSSSGRSPDLVVDSLNSLSVDIARAIDHKASVDLWDRYRKGERNVFTRRLYTMKGQQTFDEIRRKYQRDPQFREAVDRYIQDFETLLADLSRNDPDNARSREYLTSDTGKVYTMLAHASGRFDS